MRCLFSVLNAVIVLSFLVCSGSSWAKDAPPDAGSRTERPASAPTSDAEEKTMVPALEQGETAKPLSATMTSRIMRLQGSVTNRSLIVHGGSKPYTVSVSRPIVSITFDRNQGGVIYYKIVPIARGSAEVTVKDAKGVSITQKVIIQ